MKENSLFFTKELISWYKTYQRDLPWRRSTDAYSVWISEVILQQTRVNQGVVYYYKFMEAFPKIQDLADADSTLVLRHWQGLGYYSRAMNLHKAAKMISEDYNGVFPSSVDELLKLPGVGAYSAAAIASISFGVVVPAVDGNFLRVFSRFYGIEDPVDQRRTQKLVYEIARSLIEGTEPGAFNQAVMDLGAMVCLPKGTKCAICPLRIGCFAFKNKTVERLPVKTKKIKVIERNIQYLLLEYQGRYHLRRRSQIDIWKGLYDLFEYRDISDVYKRFGGRESVQFLYSETHILTHQKLHLHFSFLTLSSLPSDLDFFTLQEIEQLPKPKPVEKLILQILASLP